MAERNEKVFQRVRDELAKNPDTGSRDLYQIAKEVDGSLSGDSLQQFHARYVLPIKREQSGSKGGRRSRRAKGGKRGRAAAASAPAAQASGGRRRKSGGDDAARTRARSVLLDFARDFADAETRSDIVQVLSRVDDYVERIVTS